MRVSAKVVPLLIAGWSLASGCGASLSPPGGGGGSGVHDDGTAFSDAETGASLFIGDTLVSAAPRERAENRDRSISGATLITNCHLEAPSS